MLKILIHSFNLFDLLFLNRLFSIFKDFKILNHFLSFLYAIAS